MLQELRLLTSTLPVLATIKDGPWKDFVRVLSNSEPATSYWLNQMYEAVSFNLKIQKETV